MTTSSAVKARILQLLQASTDLEGVVIRYGQATKPQQIPGHPDVIYLGRITQGAEVQGALGRAASRESFSVAFAAGTWLTGDDRAAAEARCCAILAAMLNAFKVDGQAAILGINGGPGLLREGITWSDVVMDSGPADDPKGWIAEAIGVFNCVADVRPTP
jgi:hypothetical protein